MTPTVFIDGEAGTTGLQIAARLRERRDISVISLEPDKRKDTSARAECLNAADAAILCLPDEAARLAASLVTNPNTVIIDASTAHRTAPGWVYGFPEMGKGHRRVIASARRISNPGCYPTGFVALMRPLVAARIVPEDWPVSAHAVSGYSGGGKAMIAEFEEGGTRDNHRLYALGQAHKHLAEMKQYAGLRKPPLFMPSVGRFAQGMLVEIGLPLSALPRSPRRRAVQAALAEAYDGQAFVKVVPMREADALKSLEAEGCNNTNRLELYVFGTDDQARLVARLDNLGKGAAGAAVQNLNIALGLDEAAGLAG